MHRDHHPQPVAALVALALLGALVLVVSPGVAGAAPPPVANGVGDIDTTAGSGAATGNPTTLTPQAVAATNAAVYVASSNSPSVGFPWDAGPVVWRVDRGTGQSTLFAGGQSRTFFVLADNSGSWGDGGPASKAGLSAAGGLAVDGAGDVFIGDVGRVRRVDASTGVITTVAGSGTVGFAGDGGPATSARLGGYLDVAVDGAGDLFIADGENNRIREVTTSGTITTVAGDGTYATTGDGGPATSAGVKSPGGIAVDSGGANLFIATDNQVRRVSAGTISRYAGTGTGGYSGDGGPATSAQLSGPGGLAIDASGRLLVPDSGNNRIRRIAAAGTITTVAGTGVSGFSGDGGAATGANLNRPNAVAEDGAGSFFTADWGNLRVRAVSSLDTITTIAGNGSDGTIAGGTGDGGPATAASIRRPDSVAVDRDGNRYVGDGAGELRRIDRSGGITAAFHDQLQQCSALPPPYTQDSLRTMDVATDAHGDLFVVTLGGNWNICRIAPDGSTTTYYQSNWTTGTDGEPEIAGIAADAAGVLYVAWWNWSNYSADSIDGFVSTFSPSGAESFIANTAETPGFSGDGGPATAASFRKLGGIAVNAVGDVFVSDLGNKRIRRIDGSSGIVNTIAGTGTSGYAGDGGPATSAEIVPGALTLDAAGNLYEADRSNRVRAISAGGTISTVAGNGILGFSGDGGAATAAQLASPADVAMDASGNLLIADAGNNRVRTVSRAGQSPPGNGFHAVTPFRVGDTRVPTNVGFTPGPIGGGTSKAVTVSPAGAVPAGAAAVVLNVTATGASSASYLTAFATGAPPPTAANLLFAVNQTVPNAVTVGVGAGGQVSFFNQLGSVDVIVDVVGYFDGAGGGSGFYGITPTRILDSRTATGNWPGSLGTNQTRDLTVAGIAAIPANATAVVLNVTVTGASAASYLQAFPAGATQPVTANLLFAQNQTVPNQVTVGIGTAGKITFYNQLGSVHVIADAVGYFAPGGDLFHPLTASRILDSRDTYGAWNATPLGNNQSRTLQITGGNDIPADATGLVANITVTGATNASYLALNPTPGPTPAPTADLLFAAGQTIPNLTTVALPPNGQIDIYNQQGTTHVITDATGYYATT